MEVKFTVYELLMIVFGVLPPRGSKRWIELTRSIKSKIIFTPEEQSRFSVDIENGRLNFADEEIKKVEKSITLTNFEIAFLKELIKIIDTENGYTEDNYETLMKIENL